MRAHVSVLAALLIISCGFFTLHAAESSGQDSINLTETDDRSILDNEDGSAADRHPSPPDRPLTKPTTDPEISQEFVFADAVSQNSGISNGLADSGQPVLIKLVDNAAIELANAARNVDIVVHEKSSSNISNLNKEPFDSNLNQTENDLHQEYKNESLQDITQELQTTNNGENINKSTPEAIENAVSNELVEKTENVNNSFDNPLTENTTELDVVKKADVDVKPVEPQEDIPSFSEWTQKQLEEAERNKETVLNDSSHLIQNTVTSTVNLKVRSKNYASPDCGAKIVAANPEAGSASFILSSSRDEYMLNTCNSRIWFIVELCEAIQAKKIDLANFELFSSTPKNLSVYVSDRFPTREWAGVGQFIAQDERDIQTFNLHPHLFGKFIKVELHSHYGSEHYCPISLFRAYGTSEYEVFETENSPLSPSNPLDDDDDDVIEELGNPAKTDDLSRNLFGSARDAVMSIMKKAAEALVKSSDVKNSTSQTATEILDTKMCRTPSHIIVCDNCSNSLFTEVYDLMSCHNDYIKSFTEVPVIYNVLCNTEVCQHYGLDFKSKKTLLFKTEIASYISALLIPSYMAALCNMLAIIEKKVVLNTSYETDLNITSNLTIDKKLNAIIGSGMIDNLIQEPFNTCNGDEEYCKNIKLDADIVEEPQVVVEISSDAEIKPTKTQDDENSTGDSTVVVYPSINSNHFIPQSSKTTSIGYEIESTEVNKITEPSKETGSGEMIIQSKNESNNIIQNHSSEIVGSETTVDNIGVPSESQEINDNFSINGNLEDTNLSQEQLALDNLLEFDQSGSDPSTPAPPQSTIQISPQGQKESVFLRLSNRIKALEKNMSLSSQYLEELSRRYKKQVEEMQKTFEKTILNMNEESKRIEERDHKNIEEMLVLQQQIAQLSASVNVLLSEKDGLMGSTLFYKLLLVQVLITVIAVYILRRCRRNVSNIQEESFQSELIQNLRLRSNNLRRLSEDGMMDIDELNVSNKKKKKRKSNTVRRSLSIAGTPNTDFTNINSVKPWSENNLNLDIDTCVALEEPEFIIPEAESVDFNSGKFSKPVFNELAPKKEFPKTNGLIFGMRTPSPNDKKSIKARRLSSPAFFKAALGRQSTIKNREECPEDDETFDEKRRYHLEVYPRREVNSQEKDSLNDSLQNDWSSAGDVSQASSSNTTNSNQKTKRPKKRSFKNMLKKVF